MELAGEQQELAQSVAAWLHYKDLTGWTALLRESSLTEPIAEFLAAKYRHEIIAEMEHPGFGKVGPGRPRQLDFVRKSKKKGWVAAYECKYRRIHNSEIVFDLCRLICLTGFKEIGNPKRYFIFAGKIEEDESLVHSRFNAGGGRLDFFSGILSNSSGSRSTQVKLNELHEKQRESFASFSKEYSQVLPSIFYTELVGWAAYAGSACGVWKVKKANNSRQWLAQNEHGIINAT